MGFILWPSQFSTFSKNCQDYLALSAITTSSHPWFTSHVWGCCLIRLFSWAQLWECSPSLFLVGFNAREHSTAVEVRSKATLSTSICWKTYFFERFSTTCNSTCIASALHSSSSYPGLLTPSTTNHAYQYRPSYFGRQAVFTAKDLALRCRFHTEVWVTFRLSICLFWI